LIRHLWINLLEALTDPAVNSKASAGSPYWKNLQQTTFYTQEIIASIFKGEDQGTESNEPQRISSLGNMRTKLGSGEDFPYSNFLHRNRV